MSRFADSSGLGSGTALACALRWGLLASLAAILGHLGRCDSREGPLLSCAPFGALRADLELANRPILRAAWRDPRHPQQPAAQQQGRGAEQGRASAGIAASELVDQRAQGPTVGVVEQGRGRRREQHQGVVAVGIVAKTLPAHHAQVEARCAGGGLIEL